MDGELLVDKEPDDINDNDIPTFALEMRKAVAHCRRLYDAILKEPTAQPDLQQWTTDNHCQQRQDSLKKFWAAHPPALDVVDGSNLDAETFRKEYLDRNLPCLIRGLDQTSCFAPLMESWKNGHHQWFVRHVGRDTMVPVRHLSEDNGRLDKDGRATECNTQHMKLDEWIRVLDKHPQNNASSFYLKDWHLQQMLDSTMDLFIYQCPNLFEYDLLNHFLERFTDGDYKFCYWGPPGSRTPLHSDVLHSFSWSFNVVGTKEWTFYSPDGRQTMVVSQHAGECMFVPATWKHEVVNREETLSVNHNWFTHSNLDLVWECLVTEIKAIDLEVKAWQASSSNPFGEDEDSLYDAKESMLRGCVGLNVTSFLLLILTRYFDLRTEQGDRGTIKKGAFDVEGCRLQAMLRKLQVDLGDSEMGIRLAASLQSQELAAECLAMMKLAHGSMLDTR